MEKSPSLSKAAASKVLRSLLPDVSWLLRYAEKEGNWIRFPPVLARALSSGKLGEYVCVYGDERHVTICMVFGLFGEAEGKELLEELSSVPVEAQMDFAIEVLEELDTGGHLQMPRTEADLDAARKLLEGMPAEERERAIRRSTFFVSGFLASFFQYISVMVHGEKLTSLVARALQGDEGAFAKAAQIDRNLLAFHPFFRQRVSQAHFSGDADFLDALGYRLRNPIVKGKIRYRELWFCFSVLDTLGLLNGAYTHSELIEILANAGLDLARNGIEDEGYFAKRLKDYRRFQAKAATNPQSKNLSLPSTAKS